MLEEHFVVPYAERFEEGEFRKRVQFMHGGKLRRDEYMGIERIDKLKGKAIKFLEECESQCSCQFEDIKRQDACIDLFFEALTNEFRRHCGKKLDSAYAICEENFKDIEDVLWEFVRSLPLKLEKQLEREARDVVFKINVSNFSYLKEYLELLECRKNDILFLLDDIQILSNNPPQRTKYLAQIESLFSSLRPNPHSFGNKAHYIAHCYYSDLVGNCCHVLMEEVQDLSFYERMWKCAKEFRREIEYARPILREYYQDCIESGKKEAQFYGTKRLLLIKDWIKISAQNPGMVLCPEESTQGLIDRTFFPESISIDISRIFPVMVMATMSSGKSTLINALLGKDILPSQNAACTAKVYSVLDKDSEEEVKAYVTYTDGRTKLIEEDLKGGLEKANQDETVSHIFMTGQIRGVVNTDKALMIIDTPGPNNSRDISHGELAKDILDKLHGGLLLYVMNATQMGIHDDLDTLQMIKGHLEKNKKIKLLFVVNKVDELDLEKEPVEGLMRTARDYIESNGIEKPDIIPISALAAGLFKKVLAGEELTRLQRRLFDELYDLFQSTDVNMRSYIVTEGRIDDSLAGSSQWKKSQLVMAIENTGLSYLEDYIQTEQILCSENGDVVVAINKN